MPCDHDHQNETVLRNQIDAVAAIFDLEPSPAAPISAAQVTQQIVDVVNAWQRERGETSILKRPDPTLAGYAAVGKIGRIVAGALEEMTAENARLTEFALNASVGHGWKDRAERAEEEVGRLTEQLAAKQSALDIVWAENGHLSRIEQAAAEYVETAVALTRPHTDMDRTRAAFRNQPGAIGRLIAAVQAYRDREWYATHRAKVEADHAAAKDDEAEGLRPLTGDEIEAGSYLLTRAKDGD